MIDPPIPVPYVATLLTVPEVMARLNVGRSLVYELMASGQLRSVAIRRCRRVRSSDLDEFIESCPAWRR